MLISELPKEYQDILPPEDKLSKSVDDINSAFTWRKYYPGHEFWSACYSAESEDELPEIPPKPKDGFKVVKMGEINRAIICNDGVLKGDLIFTRKSISNCGMVLFKCFTFPPLKLYQKYKYEIMRFYVDSAERYPYILATHNENNKDYFEGWEMIHEFLNPNSNNYVQMWKLDRENYL